MAQCGADQLKFFFFYFFPHSPIRPIQLHDQAHRGLNQPLGDSVPLILCENRAKGLSWWTSLAETNKAGLGQSCQDAAVQSWGRPRAVYRHSVAGTGQSIMWAEQLCQKMS